MRVARSSLLATAFAVVATLCQGWPSALANHPGDFKFIIRNGYGCSQGEVELCRDLGILPYDRHLNSQFPPFPGGWDDGDRKGYRSAYAHLLADMRAPSGPLATDCTLPSAGDPNVLARVHVRAISHPTNPSNTAYINDTGMHEGRRCWDGTRHTKPYPQDLCGPPGTPGCQHPSANIQYVPRPRNDPVFSQPLPVITFTQAGATIEVRDYKQVIPLADPVTDAIIVEDNPNFSGTFGNPAQRLCAPQVVCHRIVIVMYQDQPVGGPMLPFAAIYYYDLSPIVTITSNWNGLAVVR